MTDSPDPDRPRAHQPRSSSAFSRIASNLSSYVAAPASGSSLGSSHSSGPHSLASASASSLANINTNLSTSISAGPPSAAARSSAFGALEALQTADIAAAERKGDPPALTRPGSSRLRTDSASSSPARGRRPPGTSRERAPFGRTASQPGSTSRGNSPAGLTAMTHDWGDQILPPNANPAWLGTRHTLHGLDEFANASGIIGASAFSFEGGGGGGGGESYRGSLGGSSSSLIRDLWPSSFGGSSFSRLPASIPGSGSRFEGVGGVSAGSWAEASTSSRVGTAGSSGRGVSGFSAALGAGGRRKESSRGMRYPVQTLPRDPRGVVAIAQPREGERGRAAVAGKTYLRVLKVPHGERSPSPTYNRRPSPSPGAIGSFRTSSLASRRSHSRGSPSPLDRVSDEDGAGRSPFPARDGDDDIVEHMDVRTGSRLGPNNIFTDVSWGYAATSSKLATALTNGAVALWDLNKEGGSKLETVKYQHDKAVNKVVFGGQSGSWIMSGGNDGQMKLWDIRQQGSSMVLKAASPVRQLAFSPSAAQPFTLLACCASGLLLRYDIRNVGAGGHVAATDRIVGHVGAILALSWRDNLPGETATAGGRGEGGWVVTGGLDKSIKVWDFGQATLAAKPVRTLWASQPVQSLAWHPTRHTELASSPLPTLAQESVHDDAGSPGGPAGLGAADAATARAQIDTHKNEIEVWDITRPYFPKYSIKTDEPTAQILYNDPETLWAGSKASSIFAQYDVAADSYALLDNVTRPGATWNAEGELAFVDDGRHSLDRSWPMEQVPLAGTAVPQFKPSNVLCSLYDPDPDFRADEFAYLAENWVVGGQEFGGLCETNAQVSQFAERPDAAQFWLTLKIWLDHDPAFCGPDTPPPTPPSAAQPVEPKPAPPPPTRKPDDWTLPPPIAVPGGPSASESAPARTSVSVPPRRSFGASLGLRRTSTSSPVVGPTEMPKLPLERFSEESSSNEASGEKPRGRSRGGSGEARTGVGSFRETVVSTSSESEHDLPSHYRHIKSGSNGASTGLRLQRSQTTSSRRSGRGRSATLLGEERLLPDGTSAGATSEAEGDLGHGPLHSRQSSSTALNSMAPSSESDSDLDSDAEERLRESRLGNLQSALASRRGSSLGGDRKAAIAAIAVDNAISRAAFLRSNDSRRGSLQDGINMSRRGSVPLINGRGSTRDRQTTNGSVGPAAPVASAGPSSKELNRREAHNLAVEAAELVKRQVQDALQAYADRGDSQLCAVAACVLRDHVDLAPLFVARVTKAYVEQLRRLELHAAAAMIIKHCATESIRQTSQNMVTWHTACGQCGKALESEPFGVCRRCRAVATQCVLCHLPVKSLLVFCAGCGHGAHSSCLATYAHTLSALKAATAPPSVSASHPSTPGFTGPIKSWLWGEPASGAASPAGEAGPGGQLAHWAGKEGSGGEPGLLQTCPHGMCGHASGCVLSEVGV